MKHHGTDTCVECAAPAGHTLICEKCAAEKGYANDNRAPVAFSDEIQPDQRGTADDHAECEGCRICDKGYYG